MFQQDPNIHSHQLTRGLVLTMTAVLIALALGTGPAAARQDAGPATARVGYAGQCFLQRVGTQYTRCDDNTGDGVPAPAWIPQR